MFQPKGNRLEWIQRSIILTNLTHLKKDMEKFIEIVHVASRRVKEYVWGLY